MQLKEMIYKRKSFRKYKNEEISNTEIENIMSFYGKVRHLYPSIKIRLEFVNKENVKCILPWVTSKVLVLYSEEQEGYLENAGFILQQLDLYIQSMGLGSCYLGMGKLDTKALSSIKDNLKYVMMLAIGHPKGDFRTSLKEFNRKSLSKISLQEDLRLEPARIAPSSLNSQPWYFMQSKDSIQVFCIKDGLFKTKARNEMNLIDMGIALAHLYISYPETFEFYKEENFQEVKNYIYIGSITI